MSKFIIKSDILQRFMNLSTVRLEVKDGKQYLIGYNGFIACVQYLGEIKDANEVVFLNIDKKSLTFEVSIGSEYNIETIPDLACGTITTNYGSSYNDMLYWSDNDESNDWFSWFTNPPKENKGFMYWDLYQIQTIFECSPSGEIIFPEYIDCTKPIVVADSIDSNWLGVFIARSESDKLLKPAKLPEWLKNADNA